MNHAANPRVVIARTMKVVASDDFGGGDVVVDCEFEQLHRDDRETDYERQREEQEDEKPGHGLILEGLEGIVEAAVVERPSVIGERRKDARLSSARAF
jgi:hypothetical protein